MILCSGAFDGLHAGHIRYLHQAHALDPQQSLRVAIAPDSYIRSAKDREPFWSQADRAETVFAIGCVDSVTLHPDDSIAATIRELKPSLVVKGRDWQDRLPEDVLAACFDVGAQVVFVDTPGRHVAEARR